MRQRIIYISFFIIVCQLGCSPKEDRQAWKNRFHQNYPHLEKLVSRLQNDPKLDSSFRYMVDRGIPDIAASYPSVLKQLQDIGITNASSNMCATNKWRRWYYFKTNWPSVYPIYIIYDPTDAIESETGFYKKDKYANETWGLGGNWKMFRFVATIVDVKQ